MSLPIRYPEPRLVRVCEWTYQCRGEPTVTVVHPLTQREVISCAACVERAFTPQVLPAPFLGYLQ